MLTLPGVQTRLAHHLLDSLNQQFKTQMAIGRVDLSDLGQVKLKDILVKDTHNDTIFYIKQLKTSLLDYKKLINGKPHFSYADATDVTFKIITYAGQNESAFDRFIDAVDGEDTTEPSGFKMTIAQIRLKNTYFKLYDYNHQQTVIEKFDAINGEVKDFLVKGPDVSGNIRNLSFTDSRGLDVHKMDTDFSYTKTSMTFDQLNILTETSNIQGKVHLNYHEGDLSDFNNKVQFDAQIENAGLSTLDLKKFYNEFGTSDRLYLKTEMLGTLNNFILKNVSLQTNKNVKLSGDYHFYNAFDTENGFKVEADVEQFEGKSEGLASLLPNLLNDVGTSLHSFQTIKAKGQITATPEKLFTDISVNTALGNVITKLNIDGLNHFETAQYKGFIKTESLKLGQITGDSEMGNISLDAKVDGSGTTLKNLKTKIDAVVIQYQYNGYNYRNITANGKVVNKTFEGKLHANDPNLKLNFEGLADLSQKNYKFDFITQVDYANFKNLNLYTRDSIAVLKGNIKINATGNRLENMVGTISIKNTTYTNPVQEYFFKDFSIASQFDAQHIQTIQVNSTDIISGEVTGKFLFAELNHLAQNALGSIYSNFKPYKVSPGQFLKFNFEIHNPVINVLFPDIIVSNTTNVRGEIDADQDLFKLNVRSAEVNAYDNLFEKIRLQIDNKNPLFNTQLSVGSFKNSSYQIQNFNLVNKTISDTLFFRSEFSGGESLKDKYNLSFYHTINDEHRSVLTFQDSDITLNNTTWKINPNEEFPNRILYNHKTGEIIYDNFLLTSGRQSLTFFGDQKGKDHVNYNIDLDRVQLDQILPDLADFDLKGLINGGIWIEKRNNMLIPKADVQIIDFTVNNQLQGDLIGEIKGGANNKEYLVNMYLEKESSKKLNLNGRIDFNPKEPVIYLVANFNNFSIDPLNAIAKDVMQNIRGELSGEAGINGKLSNPVFSGDLLMNGVGVYIPMLNIDMGVAENSHLFLENQSFTFDNVNIFDTKEFTEGTLKGKISHQNFEKWFLNIKIETDNMLALDTAETEESLFYGKAYLNGLVLITGNTDNVNIAVNGSSNPNTKIVIPMSDLKSAESSKLIHFKEYHTETENPGELFKKRLAENMTGVTMNFDFDINKNAEIQFVLDKTTGSYLQGTGNGNIIMDIDTKGKFNMYGDYVVDKGIYNFKYGVIINKPFNVKKGGTISFNGDPYKAELDIEAVYNVKADPRVILPEYGSNRKIPVELTTKITGELFNSTQEFEIKVPNAGVELASELDFVLNKQQNGNVLQFVSLLAFGQFVNENNTNYLSTIGGFGTQSVSEFASTISDALMGIIADPDDKIQLGFDFTQSQQNIENVKTDNQFGLLLSTRLGKNENIIINGEVYVPTGSQTKTNVAGNLSMEMPLSKKNENLFLKVFNRQNEIQYSDEEEGYTQGVGVSWQIDFNTLTLIPKKNKNKKPANSVSKEADLPKK